MPSRMTFVLPVPGSTTRWDKLIGILKALGQSELTEAEHLNFAVGLRLAKVEGAETLEELLMKYDALSLVFADEVL